jgi:hypothetical protein
VRVHVRQAIMFVYLLCNNTVSISDDIVLHDHMTGMDMEGSGSSLTEALSLHLLEGLEENCKQFQLG